MSLNLWIFAICSLLLGAVALATSLNPRFPGDNQGYEPLQPLEFSHRLHAGEMGMECQYCHFGARRSRHAGVPPTSVCMNCHSTVRAGLDVVLAERELALTEDREPAVSLSPELSKLYASLALDSEGDPIPGLEPRPIEWVRVHNLPDFVYFDHRPHVASKIACETCHGPVQSMERMRQFAPLTMGWCIECHRDQPARLDTGLNLPEGHLEEHATTDCVSCHL